MKKAILLLIAGAIVAVVGSMLFIKADTIWAQAQIRQSVERKFEEYRTAIKEAQNIDIKNFKEKLTGGAADGKTITN